MHSENVRLEAIPIDTNYIDSLYLSVTFNEYA